MSDNFEQATKEFFNAKSLNNRIKGVQKLQALLNHNEDGFMKNAELLFSEKKLPSDISGKFRNSLEFANNFKNKIVSETKKIVQSKDKIGHQADVSLSQLKYFSAKSFSVTNSSIKQQLEKQNHSKKLTQQQGVKV